MSNRESVKYSTVLSESAGNVHSPLFSPGLLRVHLHVIWKVSKLRECGIYPQALETVFNPPSDFLFRRLGIHPLRSGDQHQYPRHEIVGISLSHGPQPFQPGNWDSLSK